MSNGVSELITHLSQSAEAQSWPTREVVMATVDLVVAHELTAYAETITAAVRALRPHLRVTLVTPVGLDGAVSAMAPALVLASQPPPRLPPSVRLWIELYPGGSNHAVIHRADGQTTIADIDFATLLVLLDEVLPPAPAPGGAPGPDA